MSIITLCWWFGRRTAAEGEGVAQAFRPVLPGMLAATYARGGQTEEVLLCHTAYTRGSLKSAFGLGDTSARTAVPSCHPCPPRLWTTEISTGGCVGCSVTVCLT